MTLWQTQIANAISDADRWTDSGKIMPVPPVSEWREHKKLRLRMMPATVFLTGALRSSFCQYLYKLGLSSIGNCEKFAVSAEIPHLEGWEKSLVLIRKGRCFSWVSGYNFLNYQSICFNEGKNVNIYVCLRGQHIDDMFLAHLSKAQDELLWLLSILHPCVHPFILFKQFITNGGIDKSFLLLSY